MKGTITKLFLGVAVLGLLGGVAFAHADNKDQNKYDNVYVCHLNDDNHFDVISVNKDKVTAPDFLYAGPLHDKKPTKDASEWCKDNVPTPPVTPPVVTPPITVAPQATAVVVTPTVLPDTGGSGR